MLLVKPLVKVSLRVTPAESRSKGAAAKGANTTQPLDQLVVAVQSTVDDVGDGDGQTEIVWPRLSASLRAKFKSLISAFISLLMRTSVTMDRYAGAAMADNIATIMTVINNSINVNPASLRHMFIHA